MTGRITVDPASLRDTAAEIRAAALFYLEEAKEMTELSLSLPAMPEDLADEATARIGRIRTQLSELAYFYDRDIAALRMSADIIEEDQKLASKVEYTIGILDAAYTTIKEVEKQARKLQMSRSAAARTLGGADRIVRVANRVAKKLPVRLAGSAVGITAVMLNFMEYWEDSDYNLKETVRRTAITTGSGAVGGGLGRLLCTSIPNPWIKGGCVLVGSVVGAIIGDSAGDPDNSHKDPRAVRAARTPSGLLPSEIREREREYLEGLRQARRSMVEELMADGASREEAERIAEYNLPDYSELQPGP
ncbi:MAG: hypothetical protein KY391_06895 [Actinobacteria bacterium]|nr:hypothetical protein [Actinomycetota bacterium]